MSEDAILLTNKRIDNTREFMETLMREIQKMNRNLNRLKARIEQLEVLNHV